MIDDKLCDEALQRFARTPDGRLVYLKFQKVVMSVPDRGAKSGALREHSARRRFAAELMAVMAEVMAEPIGDGTDESRRKLATGEQPVVFKLDRPASIRPSRPRGAGPRVRPADEPGPAGATG